ncbi:hypothetical protein ACYULU_09475 [Breznakiellaceae bacterium SP9]
MGINDDELKDVEITELLSTEKREIHVDTEFSDLVFKTDHDFGIHIEEETDISKDDLRRFNGYACDLARIHKIDLITIILTFNKPKTTEIKTKTLHFMPIIINLKERDADKILEELSGKINRNEEINELELVFLPVCKSALMSATSLLEKGLKLAIRLEEKRATRIAAMMMVLSDNLIEQAELNRLWEEFKAMKKLKIVEFAKNQWKLEGKLEGKVLAYKDMGLTVSEIAAKTGLSEKEIVKIGENAMN